MSHCNPCVCSHSDALGLRRGLNSIICSNRNKPNGITQDHIKVSCFDHTGFGFMLAERTSIWLILLPSDPHMKAPVGGNPPSAPAQAKVRSCWQPPAFSDKKAAPQQNAPRRTGNPRKQKCEEIKSESHKALFFPINCNTTKCPRGSNLRAAAHPKLNASFTFLMALFLHTHRRQEQKTCQHQPSGDLKVPPCFSTLDIIHAW